MNTMDTSIEHRADDMAGKVGRAFRNCRQRCEDRVRKAPLSALAVAAGTGYFFKSGILAILAGAVFRVVLALLRPALVIFAGVKLYEFMSRRKEHTESQSSLVTVGPSAAPGTMEPAVIPSTNL